MNSEPLDSQLLDILVCPEDKQALWYFNEEAFLYNPRLKRKYLIQNGIPIMLIDESVAVQEPEHQRLVELAENLGIQNKGIQNKDKQEGTNGTEHR